MTEQRTWKPRHPDDEPPWEWLAQRWHWLWRNSGLASDREEAYWCARMHSFENWIRTSRERA